MMRSTNKMRALWACGLAAILLVACESTYTFWDTNHFNLQQDALGETASIKLIYYSQGPSRGEEADWYYHIVAVTTEGSDTVNILSPTNHGFTKEDGKKVYDYFSINSLAGQIMMNGVPENEPLSVEAIENRPIATLPKVARDARFDATADNRYPTVIGLIGVFEGKKHQKETPQ